MSTPPDRSQVLDLESAYRAFYAALVRLARLLGRSTDAEDIVQAVFVDLAKHGTIETHASSLRYLQRRVVDHVRTEQRRSRTRALTLSRVPTVHATDDEADGVTTSVGDALARLPRRQREVIVLRIFLDLSERDTAQLMGIRLGTVRSAANRGLRRLEQLLREDGFK